MSKIGDAILSALRRQPHSPTSELGARLGMTSAEVEEVLAGELAAYVAKDAHNLWVPRVPEEGADQPPQEALEEDEPLIRVPEATGAYPVERHQALPLPAVEALDEEATPDEPDGVAARNLTAAIDYLLELSKRSMTPVFRLADHGLGVFHEHDLRALSGVQFNLRDTDGEREREIWMRVPRLSASMPPEPSDALKPWLKLSGDPGRTPSLKDTIRHREGADTVTLQRTDHEDLDPLFERYLAEVWQPWADQEAPRRRTIAIYDRLFAMQQDAEGGLEADEGVELCIGIGMALWRHPDAPTPIQYPLLLKPVELELVHDAAMHIDVVPTDRDADLGLDPFFALNLDEARFVEDSARELFEQSELLLSPFDAQSYETVLRSAATRLATQGRYEPRDGRASTPLPGPADDLLVTDHWVLFARRRPGNYVARDLRRLREQLEQGVALPPAIKMLVTEPPDRLPYRERVVYRGLSNAGAEAHDDDSPARDLFFPKPFNAAQVAIVERLEGATGVVVQGPPGTGKTHTIANIICHALAQGQRVLVTAQHEAPLAVLREQIPEPLRPLTISLLTSEREGLRQLEQSVHRISGEINELNAETLRQTITSLERDIGALHERIGANEHELLAKCAPQLQNVRFQGQELVPSELAQRVALEAELHRNFVDRPESQEPPLSAGDLEALRAARVELGRDVAYARDGLLDPAVLPAWHDVLALHRDLQRQQKVGERVASEERISLTPAAGLAPEHLQELEQRVRDARMTLEALQAPWHSALFDAVLVPRESASGLLTVLQGFAEEVRAAEAQRQGLLAAGLAIPEEALRHPGVLQAAERGARGKRPLGLFAGGGGPLRELLAQLRIEGREPSSRSDWETIHAQLALAEQARSLQARWQQLGAEFGAPDVDDRWPDSLRGLADHAATIHAITTLAAETAPRLDVLLGQVVARPEPFEDWRRRPRMLTVLEAGLVNHLDYDRLRSAPQRREAVLALFRGRQGRFFEVSERFVRTRIGRSDADEASLEKDWQAIEREARRLLALEPQLDVVRILVQRLHDGGAPKLAERLWREAADDRDQVLPLDLHASWAWGWAVGFLDRIDVQGRLKYLAAQRLELENRLAKRIEELVEARTWLALKTRLTQKVSAALAAYLAALTKLGKGTGVRAVRHRRDARTAMATAQNAVPVWIMPHWRVSETLPSTFGAFDLVIIDEASQSDVSALPAIARAQKVLIVGDDKQVSPSDVGVREADNRMLRERFLKALPYGQHFLPGSSIYDLGSTMFAGDIVRLREHFRCAEPIIAFSNKEFYDEEIVPLRVPKASERLHPPLIDVFVKGGYRSDDGKLNRPEAEAIVAEIQHLTADERLARRSIGVVSLLGKEQARFIQERLIETLGEAVYLRHGIRCGDAMHFQGKEADIVLVSLVAAGDAIRPATGRLFEQRFNVACSRARDRLYVFRSFAREQVGDKDLKARLLDHLFDPLPVVPVASDYRGQLCETELERQLYDALEERGYSVQPQVRAGRYRIDLVVEGDGDKRLAIACDGDQYHGPERWTEDLSRQRVLERMGWRFWRVWGASWFLHRERCLEDLINTLHQLQIFPAQQSDDESGGGFVEYREVVAPGAPADDADGLADGSNDAPLPEPVVESFER